MSLPEEKIAKRALKAIEFICRQLSRFAKMPPLSLWLTYERIQKMPFVIFPIQKEMDISIVVFLPGTS